MLVRRVWPSRPAFDSPFGGFDQVRREMLRLLDTVAGETSGDMGMGAFPPLKVTQDEDNLYLRAEVPGMKSDELSISAVRNRVYSPSVDIFENDSSITVLADMPGVLSQDLKIDLRENLLTLTGRVQPPDNVKESDVLREYQPGTFYRQFTLSETIDRAKIDAELTNGVLRLELPKIEKARPRQITVRTG